MVYQNRSWRIWIVWGMTSALICPCTALLEEHCRQQREHLDCLAEAHVVPEDGATVPAHGVEQPPDALALIRQQVLVEVAVDLDDGMRLLQHQRRRGFGKAADSIYILVVAHAKRNLSSCHYIEGYITLGFAAAVENSTGKGLFRLRLDFVEESCIAEGLSVSLDHKSSSLSGWLLAGLGGVTKLLRGAGGRSVTF
ncbi:hypothetical protein DYB32_007270 [Aphanomyces invadans]|uniref:Secreted protein n=1 Tax=Aphanomyces invadans TaxID=157072 RepID=A0A3R7CXM7_9STRA|nr:hypothetical protein DYB32_007270 [Aphanomyces invadans]